MIQLKINIEQLSKKIFRLIPKRNVAAIMLTGSCAENYQKKYSDIDIILISNYAARQTYESIKVEKLIYQIIIFPISKIASVIYDDYFNEKFIFFSMIR